MIQIVITPPDGSTRTTRSIIELLRLSIPVYLTSACRSFSPARAERKDDMKNKYILVFLGFALLSSLVLAACTLTKPEEEHFEQFLSTPENREGLAQSVAPSENGEEEIRISRSVEKAGKTLSIDAVLPEMEKEAYDEIQMGFDEETMLRMVDAFAVAKYPQIEKRIFDGNYLWAIEKENGDSEFSFSCYPGFHSGNVYYDDVAHDLNGDQLDPDGSVWLPYYFTEQTPADLSFSAEEAGEKVCSLLSEYSCFSFAPWNITAKYDSRKAKGYYGVKTRTYYDGLPIYGDGIQSLDACISQEGLFYYQGTMVLKEEARRSLEQYCSFESALRQFETSLISYAIGDNVVCRGIYVGYIASRETEFSDKVTLQPAWIFECVDTQNGEHPISNVYYCSVLMENGEFATAPCY